MKGKIILIVIAMLILSGLTNSRQLDEIEIVQAMGVDITEDNKYIISAQVVNIQKEADSSGSGTSNNNSNTVVFEAKFASVQEALRNFISQSPHRLYLAHMQILLVSESAAKHELTKTLDFFLRDNEGSNNYILAVTKGAKPQEILTKTSPLVESPAESMVKSIKSTYKYRGTSVDNTLSKNLSILLSDKKELVATTIYLQESSENDESKNSDLESNNDNNSNKSKKDTGNEEGKEIKNIGDSNVKSSNEGDDSTIKVGTLAFFKDNKFVGIMDEDDSLMYNILKNNVKSALIRFGEEDDRIVAEIIESKADLKPKFVDGKFSLDIKLKMKFNITETGGNVKFETKEDILKYQDIISKEVEKKLDKYVYNCKNVYNTDLVGYREIFYKKLNKEYKKYSNDFKDEEFLKSIDTNIKVEAIFPNEGGASINGI